MTKKKKNRIEASTKNTNTKKKVSRRSVDYSKMKIASNLPENYEFRDAAKVFMDYFGDDLFSIVSEKRKSKIASEKKNANESEPD